MIQLKTNNLPAGEGGRLEGWEIPGQAGYDDV